MNIANNNQNQKELIQIENELVLLVILVIAMYIHTSLLSERLVLAVTQLQLIKVKSWKLFNDNYLQNLFDLSLSPNLLTLQDNIN